MPQSGARQAASAQARGKLLAATERSLDKIDARVDAGNLVRDDETSLRVGKVVNQYKMAKHFELVIGDNTFSSARKLDAITADAEPSPGNADAPFGGRG